VSPAPRIGCDLCIVGSGLAGMCAALFAARRGLSTTLVGRTGGIIFATGMLDLLGVHPVERGRMWDDPWAGIAALTHDQPQHPYARLPIDAIRSAFDEIVEFLGASGLPFMGRPDRNVAALTALGTFKTTYRVPLSFWAGVEAREHRRPCLIADIRGLKGFSARQIVETAGGSWPALKAARLTPPGLPEKGEVFAERLARHLELDRHRRALAASLRPHLGGVHAVGLPAILGVSRSVQVLREIETQIGRPVFEIPTMPPGVVGLRLKEAFERGLAAEGVQLFIENRVFRASRIEADALRLEAGRSEPEVTIHSRAVILATGRFLGGGLAADRHRVHETLFDLPVRQPAGREGWHRADFLDPRGHPIHRAGVEIDACFRPLDAAGQPAHPRLFAAGSILAHQDWMRMKCGAGLSMATAWGAVAHARRLLAPKGPVAA
jgi:glycerol-3-phosphate dehydrogenase subunit B